MSLQKILMTALGGALSVIVMLISAWASGVGSRLSAAELRLNTVEQHYASIESQLTDIRHHLDDLTQDLKKGGR